MTTAQVRKQIKETYNLNEADRNKRLSNHSAAGRLMSSENAKARSFFATGYTFEMSFTCGHTRIIQVAAADAGTEVVNNPCSHCTAFGIFS